MQNFCFRAVIFFVLRKVGFRLVQACDFPIVLKILILLVFWCRIPNYFLVDFEWLSFVDSLTCIWFHRFRSLLRLFFQLSLMGNSRETSLYYYWKVSNCLAGCFAKISSNSLHYIWTFLCHFVRVFCKIFLPLTIIGKF